jgi:hypothetical protein
MRPSALLFSERKKERDYSQGHQYCREGESCRRDFGARVKALLKSASHADQKRQESHVEGNYADRLARIG